MQLDVTVTQIAGFVIFCLRAEKQDLPRHHRSTRNCLCNGRWPEGVIKIKIEIVIRNSPEKVFETECVFVIVDRTVIALATRVKQLTEYADKFTLIYGLKKLKDTKEEDLAVPYMKLPNA
jgi:hypothetical protein